MVHLTSAIIVQLCHYLTITIDIYTPRHRKPKSLKSVCNILAHEIAHHQKPPFKQRWRGRIIARRHYPAFYTQVNKNIIKTRRR
jgi:hypothetical protein